MVAFSVDEPQKIGPLSIDQCALLNTTRDGAVKSKQQAIWSVLELR